MMGQNPLKISMKAFAASLGLLQFKKLLIILLLMYRYLFEIISCDIYLKKSFHKS